MPIAPDLSGAALDGRYELHAVIGEGAFGRVYRGRDRRLARQVAVKVIKPWWAEDPEWAASFEREAQLLASVNDPGIIQIFDVGAAPEGLYYVAELVDGESLASRLRSGSLTPAEACEIALQLARALARAHSQRVVHRDVKPANVLITHDGTVKVGDFGVARLAEGSDRVPATVAGTPGYMAPEQTNGAAASPATDVYGVGIVLYEMLAGRRPFSGSTPVELALRHLHDPPPPLSYEVPESLREIVERALAKDPADRYRSGYELAAALESAKEDVDELTHRLTIPGEADTVALLEAPPTPPKQSPPQSAAPPQNGTRTVSRTRVAEPRPRRRNFNPAERRQRIVLLALAVALVAGMGAIALAGAPGHLRVPNLHGMTKGRILTTARRDDFRVAISHRYSGQPRGKVIGQRPAAGTTVRDGTSVAVVLSAGPRPVTVRDVLGMTASSAQSLLATLKLRTSVTQVPAPDAITGTVTHQSPRPGSRVLPGHMVALAVAEAPRLRPLTGLSGSASARTVAFRIRGKKWQLDYSMGYQGICTFIFFCSGPSAKVTNVSTGATVDQFDLNNAGNQKRVFKTGPGVYQISISAGTDSANWKLQVDDYY